VKIACIIRCFFQKWNRIGTEVEWKWNRLGLIYSKLSITTETEVEQNWNGSGTESYTVNNGKTRFCQHTDLQRFNY